MCTELAKGALHSTTASLEPMFTCRKHVVDDERKGSFLSCNVASISHIIKVDHTYSEMKFAKICVPCTVSKAVACGQNFKKCETKLAQCPFKDK